MTKNVSLRVPLHEKRDEEIPQAHQKDSAERVRIFPQVTKRRMDFWSYGSRLLTFGVPSGPHFLHANVNLQPRESFTSDFCFWESCATRVLSCYTDNLDSRSLLKQKCPKMSNWRRRTYEVGTRLFGQLVAQLLSHATMWLARLKTGLDNFVLS